MRNSGAAQAAGWSREKSTPLGSPEPRWATGWPFRQPSDEHHDDWDFSGLEIANLEKIPARVDAK